MSMSAEVEVRKRVRELQYHIKRATDKVELIPYLCEAVSFAKTHKSEKCDTGLKLPPINPDAKLIFLQDHYSNFASFLLEFLSSEVSSSFTKQEFLKYFASYFLNGYCEAAFLNICGAIQQSSAGFKLNRCVLLLEEFLSQHRLGIILTEQSGLNKGNDTSIHIWSRDGRALQWDSLVTEMAALPDKMANKLRNENSELFLPQQYIPLLTADIYVTLAKINKSIRWSQDCSLEFISRLVGKLCLSGHAEMFWNLVLQKVLPIIKEDYIWSRIFDRILSGVPDRCVESVLVPLIKLLPWYGYMDRFLGNCVTQKQKIQLLLCTKLVFHRYFKKAVVLQNVIGYLATSQTRHHLFVKLMLEIVQVWSDKSSINHISYEQHFYLTQALIICMVFITEQQKEENKDEILTLLMPGVQHHINNPDQRVQSIGMLSAEIVTATIDPDGPRLKFGYDMTEELTSLKSLLIMPEDVDIAAITKCMSSVQLPVSDPLTEEPQLQTQTTTQGSESELDSDDDLEPYDLTADVKVTKVKQPKYIRECMEGLIGCDNPDTLECCLGAAENLIRAQPDGLYEVAAEFAKVLLHLTEGFSLPSFRGQRFNSLVALTVCAPKPVTEYLTEQFYDRNYTIRQRLDIIEVIGTAAQELSKPVNQTAKPKSSCPTPIPDSRNIQEVADCEDNAQNWKDIVQKRIESKTRRFAHGGKPEAEQVMNRFAPVAGYFFYPLMKNFDRKENTFDLMGEDCLVLGRLMYTLGIVMYAAANIPTVRQMASALMEFIWVLRFHSEASVRQGLLFAVSMVYLSLPSHILLDDLQQEVFESKNWLEDVIDKDTDTQCKTLAVQALVLLENIIKQEFLTNADLS